MSKKLISAVAAASLGVAALSAPAHAEVSANVGFLSDYIFRGAPAGEASATAGVDYAHESGFSIGTWLGETGTAGTGMEHDVYAAYGMDMDSWAWSLGVTRFNYTDLTTYETEINLGLSAGAFSLGVDSGKQEDSANSAYEADYMHVALSYAVNDIYSITVASMDPDTDTDDDGWTYLELTAGGEVAGLDAFVTLGATEEEDFAPNLNGYLVVGVSKTFDDLGF